MPAINFKQRYGSAIKQGLKRQTIRAPRRDGRPTATIGATLYLYTGMRTKSCKKLMEAICVKTSQIVITDDFRIIVNGTQIKNEDRFAFADGFKDRYEFFDFFSETYGLPFEGSLIEWRKNDDN
jgi:hypothetical protein